MIKSIVFDVDDTIYDQQEPFRRAIKKVFPFFKDEDMNQAYIRFRHHSDVGFPRTLTGEITVPYFRYLRTRDTLTDLGYDEISEEVGNEFQAVYEVELENIQMLDEMRLTLEFLKEKNIPVGVITNGPVEHQMKKVKQLGLYDYIPENHVIVSTATGFQKPQKEIFDIAVKQFGMDADTTLYVGDSYDNDVMGAYNGGWKSAWFNHRGRTLHAGTEPVYDLEIDNFEQLYGAIKVLFDLPERKFIVDITDTSNPVIDKGIKSGFLAAAEKLLNKGYDLAQVTDLLDLYPVSVEYFRNKGYK
jgi:putative hydrolase of the HAD superfamily